MSVELEHNKKYDINLESFLKQYTFMCTDIKKLCDRIKYDFIMSHII